MIFYLLMKETFVVLTLMPIALTLKDAGFALLSVVVLGEIGGYFYFKHLGGKTNVLP